MSNMGEKYVYGGHEFWCVGFIGSEAVLVGSDTVVTEIQVVPPNKSFHRVDSMEIGGDLMARGILVGVTTGERYTITGTDKGTISLSNDVTMDLNVFTAVF